MRAFAIMVRSCRRRGAWQRVWVECSCGCGLKPHCSIHMVIRFGQQHGLPLARRGQSSLFATHSPRAAASAARCDCWLCSPLRWPLVARLLELSAVDEWCILDALPSVVSIGSDIGSQS